MRLFTTIKKLTQGWIFFAWSIQMSLFFQGLAEINCGHRLNCQGRSGVRVNHLKKGPNVITLVMVHSHAYLLSAKN